MNITRKSTLAGAAALCLCAATAQAAPNVLGTSVSQGVVGDANNDGLTSFADYQILERNFNQAGTRSQGDFDGNGLIDLQDFNLLYSNLGRRLAPAFFGKIADTTTTVPASAAAFSLFNAPVIDQGGNVAFWGVGVGTQGIYRWSGGALQKVADNFTLIPSGSGTFSSFGQPSISAGRLAFQGVGTGQEGIYTFGNGVLSKVVNKTTPKPDGGGFSTFGDPTLQQNTLSFVATSGSASGAYAVAGASILSLVNSATPIPQGSGTFSSFDSAVGDGNGYWFVGRGINQVGIYKKSGDVTSVVLDGSTQIPGTQGKFTTISNLSLDGSNLSFSGVMDTVHGIYGVIDGAPRRFVDTSMMIPGGKGRFSQFGASAIGGSSIAFVGYDRQFNPGIYAWLNGELIRVIDTGVTLGGKVVTGLDMSRDAVIGNKITFSVEFDDKSKGVYSASLVPPPIAGDVTGDGRTDNGDFFVIRQNFGRTDASRAQGDLNADGRVDFKDFQIIERNQGRFGAVAQPGDVDGDGRVTNDDFALLFANFGKYGTLAQGDFTGDGKIDFHDFQILEDAYNKDGNASLIADANGDKVVNSGDFDILWANFGKAGGKAQGDFNNDGQINFNDFQILEQAYLSASPYPYNPFGPTSPVPGGDITAPAEQDALFASLVPEPSTGLIVVGMLCGLTLRKRRR
jgi:hypothetical protein